MNLMWLFNLRNAYVYMWIFCFIICTSSGAGLLVIHCISNLPSPIHHPWSVGSSVSILGLKHCLQYICCWKTLKHDGSSSKEDFPLFWQWSMNRKSSSDMSGAGCFLCIRMVNLSNCLRTSSSKCCSVPSAQNGWKITSMASV